MSNSFQTEFTPARRRLAFAAIVVAVWAVVVDGMAVGVALPVLAQQFGTTASGVTWVVAINQLVVVSCLLAFSSLGEILGYRRVHLAGLLVFVLGTLCCALAPDLGTLIAARGLQAIGAASVLSMNFAIVRHIFPPDRLGAAVGLMATAVAIAACTGPSLAGAVLSVADWRFIFWVVLALGGVSLIVGMLALPPIPREPRAFDALSALLCALTFGGLLLSLMAIGHGWSPPFVTAIAAISIVAAVVLYLRLRDAPAPLLPLDLFRLPPFTLSVTASIMSFCAQMLAFISLPFLFHGKLGLSELETGLAFSMWPLVLGATAPFAGRLADKLPPGPVGLAGLSILVVGLLLLAALPDHAGVLDIGWRMGLCGFGFAMFQSPNNRTMLGSAPRNRSGAASGMLATARMIGQALGTAIATFALAREDGAAMALVIAAGFAGLGALISISRGRATI